MARALGSPRGNGMGRSSSGHKGAANVDESTRQKVRERISAGLRRKPQSGNGRAIVWSKLRKHAKTNASHSCSSR